MKNSIFVLTIVVSVACSHLGIPSAFTFEQITSLEAGVTSEKALKDLLGEPQSIRKKESGSTQWNYNIDGIESLYISLRNKKIESYTWQLDDNNPAQSLDFALSKLKGDWQISEEEHVNAHVMPVRCYIKDEKKGVNITYNIHKQNVESIGFWQVKSQENQPTKQKKLSYCSDLVPTISKHKNK